MVQNLGTQELPNLVLYTGDPILGNYVAPKFCTI